MPYLSQLAHRYKQKYEESGEWTDCLKVLFDDEAYVVNSKQTGSTMMYNAVHITGLYWNLYHLSHMIQYRLSYTFGRDLF